MGDEKGVSTSGRKFMDVDGMMILKWVLSEKDVKAWTGLFSNCPGRVCFPVL